MYVLFGAIFVAGLLVMWGIAAIENYGAKGALAVLLLVLVLAEKAIFDVMLPAGRDEILRQNSECTTYADYTSPGCPGYRPPGR